MKFASHVSYLLTQVFDGCKSHRAEIVPTLESAIAKWDATSRISPVVAVLSDSHLPLKLPSNFKGLRYIIFLGPLNPLRLLKVTDESNLFLSIGLYNLIKITLNKDEADIIRKWAAKEKINFEIWKLEDDRIIDTQSNQIAKLKVGWQRDIKRLAKTNFHPELKIVVLDYCALIASTLSKAPFLPPEMRSDLDRVHSLVTRTLESFHNGNGSDSLYAVLSMLINVNASLTRFSSQTFTGVSQILESSGHLPHHSMLGIGTANLALGNLRQYLQESLGNARLPARFKMYKTLPPEDLRNQSFAARVWDENNLERVVLDESTSDPIIPLISFFSARDGFKSTLYSISAPLTTVWACNALQWSLLTVTHEISHILIKNVLAELYPNLSSDSEVAEAYDLVMNSSHTPESLFDEIRFQLFIAIIKMHQVATQARSNQIQLKNPAALRSILMRWQKETEEILVHVFDFLYFYGNDIQKYVESIWITWGTIPNLTERMKEYVIRTICVALSTNLRRENAEELARDQVLDQLRKMEITATGSIDYIKEAVTYIEHSWSEILILVQARSVVVRLAKAFLFSDKIAAKVRGETEIIGNTGDRQGYALVPREFGDSEIQNPLRFLEMYTTSHQANTTESFWMIYILAFSIKSNGQ